MSEMVKTEYVGLQDKVLARIRQQPGETPRGIASYLEADYNSVTRALSRLKSNKQVYSADGFYLPILDLPTLLHDAFGIVPTSLKTSPWQHWLRKWRELAGWVVACVVAGGAGYILGYSWGR